MSLETVVPQENSKGLEDIGQNIDAVFDRPEQISTTTLEYSTGEPEGLELRPEHVVEFSIPENMQGRVVRDVVLQHRKAEQYRVGTEKHDPAGAYSRVELHDPESDTWVSWKDPAGYSPDKYAEWRSSGDPEHEVLHDWVATVGPIKPDKIRVTNVGKDPDMSVSQIHQLDVVFFPDLENVQYQESIYTPGTSFIDIENGKMLPSYGGGEKTRGRYENAVRLNGYGSTDFQLCGNVGEGVEVADSAMYINLEPNKKLSQVEVIAGDTEHLGNNSSTGFGKDMRLGWAKLWVGIQKADTGEIEWFIKKANVPPQGVIAGGPDLDHTTIEEGDKLVIQSRDDTSYIMGWRVGYEQADVDDSEALENTTEVENKPKRRLNLTSIFKHRRS